MAWPKVDNSSDLFLPSCFLHCFSSRLKQRKDYEQLSSVVNDVDNGNVDNIDNGNINNVVNVDNVVNVVNVVNVDNVDIDNVASVWRQHPSSQPLESPFLHHNASIFGLFLPKQCLQDELIKINLSIFSDEGLLVASAGGNFCQFSWLLGHRLSAM